MTRRHRRVVAMSPRDRARAAAGEDVFAPQVSARGLGTDETPGRRGGAGTGSGGPSAREAEILREVPPHWFGGRGA